MLSHDPPPVIMSVYFKYWVFVVVCLGLDVIGRFIAADFLGAIMIAVIWLIAWHMTRSNCKNMNQQCLISLGCFCLVQLIFEGATLLMCLIHGRASSSVSALPVFPPGGSTQATMQVTTIKHHALFDESQGWLYNFYSFILFYTPILLALLALLCYMSYKEFGDPFADDEHGDAEYAPFQGAAYPGTVAQYGGVGQAEADIPQSRSPAAAVKSTVPFSGQGQRLGV